jgi:hypothetical protein
MTNEKISPINVKIPSENFDPKAEISDHSNQSFHEYNRGIHNEKSKSTNDYKSSLKKK